MFCSFFPLIIPVITCKTCDVWDNGRVTAIKSKLKFINRKYAGKYIFQEYIYIKSLSFITFDKFSTKLRLMSRDYIYLGFLQANSRSACNISFSWTSIISFRERPEAGATDAHGEFDAAINQFSVFILFLEKKKRSIEI